MSTDKKTAIVTGLSSGMGAAVSKLAQHGWNVAVNAANSMKDAGEAARQGGKAGSRHPKGQASPNHPVCFRHFLCAQGVA